MPTTPAYDIGDLRRLTAAFTVNAAPTDPTVTTFAMLEPDGVKTTYVHGQNAQLVRDSAGNFHVDWTLAKPGRHLYHWSGAGTATEAEAGEFWARRKEAA